MKIVVVGLGYVGSAMSILLSKDHSVVGVDLDSSKVEKLNKHQVPIKDRLAEEFLKENNVSLKGTTNLSEAILDADLVVLCLPTNYDADKDYFDTAALQYVIETVHREQESLPIVVKSTIPIGFVEHMRAKFEKLDIFFSPEFLREGNALRDNLHPSRIIVGSNSSAAVRYSEIMLDAAIDKNVPVLFVGPSEAEAIKLFSNTFLAMRVSFFNELDSFCVSHKLDTRHLIDGICLDPRIGQGYSNPSFGYGGYCLPKDTKQLLANFKDVPQNLFSAIVQANETRKYFIFNKILEKKPETVGIYRLTMKSESDNFRSAAVFDIIDLLVSQGIRVVIFEPQLSIEGVGSEVINDFDDFISCTDLILANRYDSKLDCVHPKVFTRDVFGVD